MPAATLTHKTTPLLLHFTLQADWLNGKHVVFGRVLKGMDIVDEISDLPVDATSDKPLTPVVISGCKGWKEQPKKQA